MAATNLQNPNNNINQTDVSFLEEDPLVTYLKENGLYYDKDLSEIEIPDDVLGMVSKGLATQYRILPLSVEEDGTLTLITDSAESVKHESLLQNKLKHPIRLFFTNEENLRPALRSLYGISSFRFNAMSNREDSAMEEDVSPLRKKVNEMLTMLADKKGSDLHVLPYSGGVYVWMRINGRMQDFTDYFNFMAADGPVLVNIFKGLDTSNNADSSITNMPNSGSWQFTHRGIDIDCRLATVPVGSAIFATQKVNVREMPQHRELVSLDKIYFGEDLKAIKRTLYKGGSGLFLMSGPVGTGKSTALYAQISYLWDLEEQRGYRLNVFCIENPIEIRDERFTQVQVRLAQQEELSLTAPKALKVALRSDPDIILYGEIRDSEDADVAVKASQTGLKMFSTVHAGDCIRTINRLLDLDVSRMSLLSELKLIICQRLIAMLCPHCSHEHVLTEQEKSVLSDEEINFLTSPGAHLRERGSKQEVDACKYCNGGIIGRVAVPEYVIFDADLRDALLHMNDFHTVQDLLKRHGFQSMWQKGLALARDGRAELADVISKIGKD